jgi:hypothetical protein
MRTPAISKARRHGRESGYALLFVFVLAATVAVSLYYELPRIMFERTREREQLLIDRGEQYSLAIRRFYVKFGRWPTSMDELENTNNIRFLRRQYKDPMTGKADWRIIHEAAGVLTDSLVHPANPLQGQNGANGTSGVGAANSVGGASWATGSNNSPFNQSFGTLTSSNPTGSSMTASDASSTPEPPAPKAWGMSFRPSDRGPTGKAHGGVSANDDMMTDSGAGGDQGYVSAPDSGAANPAMPANPNPPPSEASNANAPAGTGTPEGGQPAISPNQTAGAGGTGEAGTAGPNAAILAIQQSLTSPRQQPTPGTGGTGGNASSPLSSGGIGIAGVASTSEMQGVKRYKDRSKYKEWEFVFDMSSLQQLQNPQQQQQQQQQGQAGQNGQIGQPSTPTAPQQPPPGLGGITQPSSGNGP